MYDQQSSFNKWVFNAKISCFIATTPSHVLDYKIITTRHPVIILGIFIPL